MDVPESRPLSIPAGTSRPVSLRPASTINHGETSLDAAATDYWYELVDQRVAADWLGVKPRTVADWRHRGVGPNWVSISPTCKRYRRIDLAAYVEARTQTVVEDGENKPADASETSHPEGAIA